MSDPTARPLRRISSWKVFGLFCLVSFLFLLGVVFVPWDIRPVEAPDLELKIPEIAPADNAFTWFEKAGKAVVTKLPDNPDGSPRDWTVDLTGRIGASCEKWDPILATEGLAANAAVFPDFERGLSCQHYVAPRCESDRMHFTWLKKHEKLLTLLLCLKSKQLQLAGDPAAAAKPALQAFRLGKMILDSSNGETEWFVGIACESIALRRLEELIADANTPDSALMEIQAALDQWNPQGFADGCKNTMRGQYQCKVQTIKEILDGSYRVEPAEIRVARYVPYLLKPNMMNRGMAAFYRHQIASVDLPFSKLTSDYPGKLKYPDASMMGRLEGWTKPNSEGLIFFSDEIYYMGEELSPLHKKFHIQVYISALRLKIAVRLYENRHGQLPDDLSALVPEFMKEIPNDPYADKPFHYSKEKKLLWSVGADGIDDGGKCEPIDIMYPYGRGRDAVMPLGTRELKPNLAPKPSGP
jgi:hypothetical protein